MEPNNTAPIPGLTPLADLAYTPLFVGTPAVYLFKADGTRVDRELVALSMQLRLAEALAGTAGASKLARLTVLTSHTGLFCEFISELASEWGSPTPFVEGIEEKKGVGTVVTVQYTTAEQLFYVGIRWQQRLTARRQEGGAQ